MTQHFPAPTGFPDLSCAVLMNPIKLRLSEQTVGFHCWMCERCSGKRALLWLSWETLVRRAVIWFSLLWLIPRAKTFSASLLCWGYSYVLTFISPSDGNSESEIPLKLSSYMFKPLWHFSRQCLCPCLCRRPWWPWNTFIYDCISIISMATCFSSCRLRIAISWAIEEAMVDFFFPPNQLVATFMCKTTSHDKSVKSHIIIKAIWKLSMVSLKIKES